LSPKNPSTLGQGTNEPGRHTLLYEDRFSGAPSATAWDEHERSKRQTEAFFPPLSFNQKGVPTNLHDSKWYFEAGWSRISLFRHH